ncbi:AAEL012445-PA [Aedes aegypti]|uniref:AAEL012445-PA n=1 Tax=Aedes aegypti TaxID=7159 RepID=Q16M25_AEDAE|nr:AAEL012445-PA [Aedes aegypti]
MFQRFQQLEHLSAECLHAFQHHRIGQILGPLQALVGNFPRFLPLDLIDVAKVDVEHLQLLAVHRQNFGPVVSAEEGSKDDVIHRGNLLQRSRFIGRLVHTIRQQVVITLLAIFAVVVIDVYHPGGQRGGNLDHCTFPRERSSLEDASAHRTGTRLCNLQPLQLSSKATDLLGWAVFFR